MRLTRWDGLSDVAFQAVVDPVLGYLPANSFLKTRALEIVFLTILSLDP
jgi:hypothetical protein